MNTKIKLVTVLTAVLLFANIADAKTLSIGSTGYEVATLQSFLIDNGFPIPLIQSGRADKGYFGEQTRNAVMMYQENNGMTLTGFIDSEGYGVVKLGSVSSPDIMSPYIGVGGVRDYYYRKDFDRNTFGVTGTTTPCSFLSPAATSTLLRASVNITLSTSTPAVKWTLATSTTAYATTTSLYKFTAVAGTQHSWEYIATTTTSAGSPVGYGTVPPSTYINLANEGVISQGTSVYGFRIGGSCQAVLEVL